VTSFEYDAAGARARKLHGPDKVTTKTTTTTYVGVFGAIVNPIGAQDIAWPIQAANLEMGMSLRLLGIEMR
jgi:hypothetical protein